PEPAAEETTAAPEPAAEETTAAPAATVEETPVAEVPVEEPPVSPFDLPGDWYVIHSYSGYENKVKVNLESRIQSMHMEDRIYEVHIPMEDVVEIKAGKKVTVNKKVFPGYILVRMTLDDDSWYAVRNTPGVTGFVAGNAQKPTPLSRREVERFLGVQKEEEKGKPRFKPDWEFGEQVRVVTGPFADFNGVIEEINIDQQKIVVLVNIFGRDTPVELGFDDIQKS
ncbi:MAG: transcription termination/antitermination protein NusG, partial [Acidimicrobiia bacterium]